MLSILDFARLYNLRGDRLDFALIQELGGEFEEIVDDNRRVESTSRVFLNDF